MKKLLTISLIMATTFALNAQTFTKYVDNTKSDGRGFAYNLTVRISLLRTASPSTINSAANGTEYSVELVRVDLDKNKGWYESGKFYNCSQLEGVCNTKTYSNIILQLSYNCQGKELETNTATFYNIGDKQIISLAPKSVGNSSCNSPTASGIGYVSINNYEIANSIGSIIQKTNKVAASTSSQTTTSSTSTTTAASTSETKNYELKLSDIGISGSNSTVASEWQQNYELGQDIGNALVDIFGLSPEEQARKEKQRLAQIEAYEKQKTEKFEAKVRVARDRFQNEYMPLLHKAEKGDETARMILYYASFHLYSTEYVPKRDQWRDEAYINKNPVARMEVANKNIKNDNPHWISWLQRAADAGSPDAMLRLADYYDRNSNVVIRGNTFTGGDNAKLALELYTKAAERGSPNAMYYLGMIYKYGQTPDITGGYGFLKKVFVLHDVVIDEVKAFEWFKKSSESSQNVSLFAKGSRSFGDNYTDLGSYFEKKAYRELSLIYKKGKIVPKDKAKAKELMQLYESYGSKYDKYEF